MVSDEEERRAFEAIGLKWQKYSDEYLVGFVADTTHGRSHNPAIVEMQRRQVQATRDFNEATRDFNRQSTRLTKWIIFLTVGIGVVALLQLAAMFWAARR